MCNAAEALQNDGATEVHAYVVHGVLSGQAVERITNSPLETLIVTDSIEATDEMKASKSIHQISIAPLIGEAARRISEERSISELFK